MDIVTVANEAFQKFLQRFIDNRLENANTFVQYLPSLVSRYGYEEMPPLSKNASKKMRIGLIKTSEEDLLSLEKVLFEMRKAFDDKIEFIYFGKPHSVWEVQKLFEEYQVETHPTVSFLDYFEKLNSLQLDVVLLPAIESLFNRHQNHQLFIELSVFGIPVVASIHHPAKAFIKDGETGFIASVVPEWIENLSLLVDDVKTREYLSRTSLKYAWANHSYRSKNLESIIQSFI
nr:hypothetical protein [Nonlabens ulvanivorans]